MIHNCNCSVHDALLLLLVGMDVEGIRVRVRECHVHELVEEDIHAIVHTKDTVHAHVHVVVHAHVHDCMEPGHVDEKQ